MRKPLKEGDLVRYRYPLDNATQLVGRVDLVDQTNPGVVFVHWLHSPAGAGAWRPCHTLKRIDPLTALATCADDD